MSIKSQEIRKPNRLEVFGSTHPVCVICGEGNGQCLEQHHIAGQAYSDDLCNVCRNCHRKLSDDQRDHPIKLAENPQSFETIGHLLIGLADFFELLVERLREYGLILIKAAKDAAGKT
jgi:hypothetical protein